MLANLARSGGAGGGEFTTFLFTPTEETTTITIPELAGKKNVAITTLAKSADIASGNRYAVMCLSIQNAEIVHCVGAGSNLQEMSWYSAGGTVGVLYDAATGTIDFSKWGTVYSNPRLFLATAEYIVTCW